MNIFYVCIQFVAPGEMLATVITRQDNIGVRTGFVAQKVAVVLVGFGAFITRVGFLGQVITSIRASTRGFIQSGYVLFVAMLFSHMCLNFVLP